MKLNLLQFLIILFLTACNPKPHPLIPREVLFFGGDSDKTGGRLSHDGRYLSYFTLVNKIQTICISPIEDIYKGLSNRKCLNPYFDKGISYYMWAFDNKHIIYTQDPDGSENTGLYMYNVDTEKYDTIFASKGSKAAIMRASYNKPNQILVGINQRDKKYFDVYSFNFNKCDSAKQQGLELIFKNDKFTGLQYDSTLNLRFASSLDSEGAKTLFKYSNGKFEKLFTFPPEEATSFGIVGFNKDNSKIYILDSRNSDTDSLKEMDLATGITKTIVNEQKSDLSILTKDPIEKNIQAVRVNYTMPEDIIIDESIRDDYNFLKSLNKGLFSILSRTIDDKLWLVLYFSDTNSGEYYLYDRSKKTIKFLFNAREKLSPYHLVPMQPVIIKSRDGLDLVSYITMPKLHNSTAPYPLIVYVHGGPSTRDTWGYDTMHQWFANRGYAVLSVNYRGSSGFGKNFLNAGNREWGRKMHQDIIDAVNWAIEQKITDPKKIAIMGGSYGGYETLIALTMNPELFACGIDIVGPSDLITLIKSVPEYWKPIAGNLKKKIGDIDSKKGLNLLTASSPINFVDKITKPLLIAQGANDPRVKKEQSDKMVEALQKRNIAVLYVLYPDEGHGFRGIGNKLSFYAITEQFLASILGGRAEPLGTSLNDIKFILNGKKNKNSYETEKIINGVLESYRR
ncbi:MAG: S9 family peptidase [Rickettsia endosymbiont of Labidopullus appendiculatus]|nr:S9 family peptidase [Rickettsia endosymbiont of Labidopullus appendiculatus]